MYDQHIVLDFEMNPVERDRDIRKKISREIIQIGAIKLNEKYEVTDKHAFFVRPQYNKKIARCITKLTGIKTADAFRGYPFEDAVNRLSQWIGSRRSRIYSWSLADFDQLERECMMKSVGFPDNMGRWMDFQAIYSKIMGYPSGQRQISLHKAAEQFGICMDKKKEHNALYDAEVTADLVAQALTGNFRKQAEMLRLARDNEKISMSQTIGDACGSMLQKALGQMQEWPQYVG